MPKVSSIREVPMKRSSPELPAVRAGLAEHFELFLTVAGVLLAILVTASQLSHREQGMSLIFLIWLQGFILWAVHRHGWLLRRALVQKMHSILQDRMKDQFTVMLSVAELLDRDVTQTGRERLEAEFAAAHAVWLELESVSFESLRTWGIRDSSLALLRL
jgi:hypothetical protein